MKKIDNGVKNRLIRFLIKQGFNVNYKAVSSMVGQMHSRLGILQVYLNYEHNVYTIKEDYLGIVKMVLTPFSSYDSISLVIDNNQVHDCVSLKTASL